MLTMQYTKIEPGDRDTEEMSEDIDDERMFVLRRQQKTHRNTILITKYIVLAFLFNAAGLLIIYSVLSRRTSGTNGVETKLFPARKSNIQEEGVSLSFSLIRE